MCSHSNLCIYSVLVVLAFKTATVHFRAPSAGEVKINYFFDFTFVQIVPMEISAGHCLIYKNYKCILMIYIFLFLSVFFVLRQCNVAFMDVTEM